MSRVTFLSLAPPAIAGPQPVLIIPVPQHNREAERDVERVPAPARAPAEAAIMPEAIAPGIAASVFRPIRPEDRAWALAPVVSEAAKPAQPATAAAAEPNKDDSSVDEPPMLPGPPVAATAPNAAHAQFLAFGNEAFTARQYARAERNFRRATEEWPQDPLAHFLLAQARFALGKYVEAVAAIHAGMRWQPDWPKARFRPRDCYAAHGNDFSEQVNRLAAALARYPDDPVLIFLYGYQLWFDNRKDEARPMFRRAQALAPEPRFSERFLQSKADAAVDDAVLELFPPGPRF